VYDALPFAVMIAAAWRWKKRGANDSVSIPLSAGIAAVLGAVLYLIVPAAGPGFLWGARYPTQPPSDLELGLRLSAVNVGDFRNAMPSLHFTGALIVALGTWSLDKPARAFGVAMVIVTALATLGSGQHYVIDLVVAVPFTLAIEAAVRRVPRWQTVSLINGVIVLAWLAVLRWAPSVVLFPPIAWIAVLATLVAPVLLWHRNTTERRNALGLAESAT